MGIFEEHGATMPALDKSTPIAGAIVNGDCSEVERLVREEKADPNAFCCQIAYSGKSFEPNYYVTPLEVAIYQGNVDAVRKLLSLTADPNKKSGPSGTNSPMSLAEHMDRNDFVELLQEAASVMDQKVVVQVLKEKGGKCTFDDIVQKAGMEIHPKSVGGAIMALKKENAVSLIDVPFLIYSQAKDVEI